MSHLKTVFLFALLFPTCAMAQTSAEQEAQIDSIKHVLKKSKHDTVTLNSWKAWHHIVENSNPVLSFELIQKIDSLSSLNLKKDLTKREKIAFKKAKGSSLIGAGSNYLHKGDLDKALDSFNEGLKIFEEINNKRGMALTFGNLGNAYNRQGELDTAFKYYAKSQKLYKEIEDKGGIATCLNDMGVIHIKKGDNAEGIDKLTQSLKIREEINDKKGMANALSNIGIIYVRQGDNDKGIEYFIKSMELEEEIGNKKGVATTLHNIGYIYRSQGDYKNAIDYTTRGLVIREEIGDKPGLASSLNNLGTMYSEQGENAEAIKYFTKGLEINKETGDKLRIAQNSINLGSLLQDQGNNSKALGYISNALDIAQDVGAVMETKDAAQSLSKVYQNLGQFKESLEMYKLFIVMRDSITNEENQKAVIRQEYKYEYEKEAAKDSIVNAEAQKVKDAQIEAEQAKNERNKTKIKQGKIEEEKQAQRMWYLGGILALALLFGGFIFNRFRVTKKQRDIIDKQKSVVEEQKHEVEQQKEKVDEAYEQLEEKNTEILDSINYAKRIQTAILPPQKLVKSYLDDSFILYKPKDIVAGDFYWLEAPGSGVAGSGPNENGVLFAAADCTGHGVPGAMVSVVCNNGLNRSVREYGLTDPGLILDKTREIVIAEFEKSEEEVKDGMDIALCSLNGTTLKYAGANNPLWIIRKDATEIEEIKADKQPIGKYAEPKPYTTHTVELQKGDTFFVFSDGYADQFGGEKGKKFKTANFKRLLLSIQNETIEKQKELIDVGFENWMSAGEQAIEQLDDVCVIGVRV
jgi:tetratricopeptide (TPR) repeat protein